MITYRNEVAAAIGGKPDAIEKFAKAVKQANLPDKMEILKHFQVIKIEDDFSVCAVYFSSVSWFIEAEETWEKLTEMADKAGLFHVFYRIGEDINDIKVSTKFLIGDNNYECRMEDIFSISRSILFNYPNLNCLN
jgi:hypothetical protein